MAGIGIANPLITQGLLNRVRVHTVVAENSALNVTASYMGKSQAQLTFEPPFVDQIETATGIINSPKPFVMGSLVINLLRSQSLANDWLNTTQVDSQLGTITVYGDSTTFEPITLYNTSITDFDPGAFDGQDPIVKLTIRGVFYVNNDLWVNQ